MQVFFFNRVGTVKVWLKRKKLFKNLFFCFEFSWPTHPWPMKPAAQPQIQHHKRLCRTGILNAIRGAVSKFNSFNIKTSIHSFHLCVVVQCACTRKSSIISNFNQLHFGWVIRWNATRFLEIYFISLSFRVEILN